MAASDLPKRPPGRPKGSRNKVSKQGQKFAQRLVNDQKFRDRLQSDMRTGNAAPGVVTRLMEYAWGKPPDQVTIDGSLSNPAASALGPITLVINGKTYKSTADGE